MKKKSIAFLLGLFLAAGMVAAPAVCMAEIPENIKKQIETAQLLSNEGLEDYTDTIIVLLQQCIDALGEEDPDAQKLRTVIVLLETGAGNKDSVSVLLNSINGELSSDTQSNDTQSSDTPSSDMQSVNTQSTQNTLRNVSVLEQVEFESPVAKLQLPLYETDVYDDSVVKETVWLSVPGEWGNNDTGGNLTSYSPANGSGAISPTAGTLTVSYFPMEAPDAESAFDGYENNIAGMSVTTELTSENIQAANLPARKIDFTMCVGANQFVCETICFAVEDTVYAIEMMQGNLSELDYFPTYYHVVGSAQVGDGSAETETSAAESPEEERQKELPAEEPRIEEPRIEEPRTEEPRTEESIPGDIGTFLYKLNGHTYQFPNSVSELQEGDVNLNRDMVIPYAFCSDADMSGGIWTEIVNTQYFYFENSLYKEMAGVTNLTGYDAPLSECVLTALIDTQGDNIDIELPGGIRVGDPERDILNGFPEFTDMPLDGMASYRGNELLYACNVRKDGCNGYVLIRNDAPYYSAVSIICENGIIKEISYECIGSERANGVFLE